MLPTCESDHFQNRSRHGNLPAEAAAEGVRGEYRVLHLRPQGGEGRGGPEHGSGPAAVSGPLGGQRLPVCSLQGWAEVGDSLIYRYLYIHIYMYMYTLNIHIYL